MAVSTALTEGNGPYSNPLKHEGYERFKCTETSGVEETKKKKQGEVWRGPILRLIESSFGTAGTSLKNDGVFSRETRIRAACCSYSITRKREPGECICFIATTEQPSVSPKEAGHTFVIYDNCFLQKSVNILWWLFPGGVGADTVQPRRDVSSDGAEKLLGHDASDAGEVNGAEYGVKTVVVSRMTACRQAHGQASLTSNNSTGAHIQSFSQTRTFIQPRAFTWVKLLSKTKCSRQKHE